ncbi:MAG: CRTAC1 family protein, partial [Armatimonadota bacterium]|nr:CRTAC1 family protein [Armatimonadota bacterium]
NNGDGTFLPVRPFAGVVGLYAFAWADIDGDCDNDAALIDTSGKLRVFSNERSGSFRERPVPSDLKQVEALATADINNDGVLDFVALQADDAIRRLSTKNDGKDWDISEVLRLRVARDKPKSRTTSFLIADMDNNGGLDLVVSYNDVRYTQISLCNTQGEFHSALVPVDASVTSIADLNDDGRLDLVGLDKAGRPVRLMNRGTKPYHWLVLRPLAKEIRDDTERQRINTFGVGGEMGMRSGLLYQKQPITGPRVHFGLGEHSEAEVVRIIWHNGDTQAEFSLKADQVVVSEQRLTGSCPYLFAWDGQAMSFVKDCNWRSPLGLKINGQDTAGVIQTEDWVKLRSDQLAPRHGFYDLRVTAELWEAHFFDHVSLLAVDHPRGTSIAVDERFSIPMPPLAVHVLSEPHPVSRAWDERGHDVTELVRTRNGRYLDSFGHGQYQGVTRDHYVEIALDDTPPNKPLRLIAEGWLRPTDSSINVALSQGRHDPPRGLSLEVPDGQGGWKVVRSNLGFPSGKNKSILIDLNGVFVSGASRRLRLRTNLEIYWDQLSWAVALPTTPVKKQRLLTRVAELRYRGFSTIKAKDHSSPELPLSYDQFVGTSPRWLDLAGYYTRFGDVRELLQKVDDRYVIMNAGDEMVFQFAVPPSPQSGWVRDFVFITDGWTKDGNLNTTFSQTVLPLPAHNRSNYSTLPSRLQDDPIYRRHARDWQVYHTRYVTPRHFKTALRPGQLHEVK